MAPPALRPQPGVLELAPYKPGKPAGNGVKLSANENCLGPSPKAIAAIEGALTGLQTYPDPSAARLRQALAGLHGLDAARVICSAGSDELIALLCQAYLGPGDNIVQSRHGFLMYGVCATACGAEVRRAPEADLQMSVEAIAEAADARTRLCFIANPNNPTGAYLNGDALRRLRAALPEGCLLVLDGAYTEYVGAGDYEDGLSLVAEAGDVAVIRTFSKIHGLAALRIGWGYFPAGVADALNRIRGPFNVSTLAQAAGEAAVLDGAHAAQSAAHNTEWRAWLKDALEAAGLVVHPSEANFLLIDFASAPISAEAANAALAREGLIVRETGEYGLPSCLRVTIGLEDANRRVADVLKRALADASV